MHDHVVVCGWGRVGRAAARDLVRAGTQVVVIDSQNERRPRHRPADGRRRRHARPDAALRRHRAGPGAGRGPGGRRRQPVRHALEPGDEPRPVHRGPSPPGRQRRQAQPCRGRPRGQPTGARGREDGIVRRPAERGRVRRRRDARALDGLPDARGRDRSGLAASPGPRFATPTSGRRPECWCSPSEATTGCSPPTPTPTWCCIPTT